MLMSHAESSVTATGASSKARGREAPDLNLQNALLYSMMICVFTAIGLALFRERWSLLFRSIPFTSFHHRPKLKKKTK